ncbi:ABC transporter ATP-binding protein [Roseibium aggregatum]|jgi:multiple sugar transport system ATP-binding protein|uniref:ABC transporter ATP-binding protein n=1 Tax=Roseibium aggregatum (strain ATCC 25650 / DSM 13394 / JCM 20685 / NBRC 16684 / NCIMB 2208 / IAM 12614 / B1) TaxID=384765 RepID=A0P3U4_ROSAI|nr:ABC transporter ATP-binding protein [Roseibium aggregatum]EAV40288.1 ABC transporter ATP-binding protein [Stappia aggregata IAM 12614] [Roseibium aggregatum IAM 12614]
MSEVLLDLQRINKIYNETSRHPVRAVKDLNLNVAQGEIVALLGSSGCGKTSTLRMIAGFEAVSSGQILIKGRPVHALAPARRNVAMAFEGYSLYPPLTVEENIAFALKSERLAKDEIRKKVAEIAHLLEIEDILERYPGSISGGQQQRASLARALIRDADLHLLDEPMGQLEPQLRALLRGRIKHFIKERGLTAILVTHDQTEANALADRIAVMEGGVLQQFDSPLHLKDRPANLFTGTFIGEPPMNVFPAQAEADGDNLKLNLADGVCLTYPASAFSDDLKARLLSSDTFVIGVRPHAVKITPGGHPAKVYANQWLGDQTHVAARFAGQTIVSVRHDRAHHAPGETIGIDLAASDLHIFAADSGRAFSHGGALA